MCYSPIIEIPAHIHVGVNHLVTGLSSNILFIPYVFLVFFCRKRVLQTMLNNPENTEEIVNELNEVEIKIKNLKTLLKNKEGRFCISEDWGQLYNPRLLI